MSSTFLSNSHTQPKFTVSQLVKKFPVRREPRKLIAVDTKAYTSSIQSNPHAVFKTHLILSSNRCLNLKWGSFLQFSKQSSVRIYRPTHATWHAHFILLYFIALTLFWDEDKLCSFQLCIFSRLPSLAVWSPNNLLSTLFSNSWKLYSSFEMNDQVSTHIKNGHNYNTVYIN